MCIRDRFSTFAPKARIIHVDLDPAEMGKNLTIDTPVIADALLTLRDLLPLVEPNEHPAWLAQINEWRGESVERDILTQETDELIAPYIMRQLWHATNQGNATIVTDVGQHQMWEAQYFNHTKPRSLLTSGGLGTMGYSLPAAIGAQMGKPEEEIWAVSYTHLAGHAAPGRRSGGAPPRQLGRRPHRLERPGRCV